MATAAVRSARPTDAIETPVAMRIATSTTATSSTAAPAVPRPECSGRPDERAEIPARVLQRVRVRERRRVLGELGQAAHAEQPEHGADGEAPRVGAGGLVVPVVVVLGARPAVDEQRDAGAGRDQRQQHADPSGQQREGGVGAAADRAELAAPQGEGQQDAERDQPDGPQVAGLHPPERRPRRRRARPGGPGRPVSWRRRGRAHVRVVLPPRVLVTTVTVETTA